MWSNILVLHSVWIGRMATQHTSVIHVPTQSRDTQLQPHPITRFKFAYVLANRNPIRPIFSFHWASGLYIFNGAFSCLMKYIHAREYNRSSDYKVWNKRYLMIMALIAMCIIVLGTIP